jgi:hypothetical protein
VDEADHPELVCTLATGVVEGIAAAEGAGRRVTGSTHDPSARRCAITLGD